MRGAAAIVFVAAAGLAGAILRPSFMPLHERGRPGYDEPAAAARFFAEQRAWPRGIPRDWNDRAIAHVRRMEENGMRKSADGWRWLSLGPENVAGRIRSMAIDPADASVIYAGSAGGGVWKSTNSGRDWRVLDDLLPNLRIGAIDVDPHDRRHVLAGCGEGYVAWQGGAAFGRGLYRSRDAGERWTLLPSSDRTEFDYVFDVDFDPHSSGVILVCTATGVWRSGDGG